MRSDTEGLLARIVEALTADGRLADVEGALTGDQRAGRARLRVTFTLDGEQRTFLYHVRREAPVHTMARSLVDDTLYTLQQRVREGIRGQLQPNDVYYPSALGIVPTRIPGQPSVLAPR